jgi:hypothetical protein
MSVPALASGARALARIPGLFSASFRHSTIFFTLTAILSSSFLSKIASRFSSAEFYCGVIRLQVAAQWLVAVEPA